MVEQKIEAVSKVSSALDKQQQIAAQHDIERGALDQEHFKNLIDNMPNSGQIAFERVDDPRRIDEIEKNPILTEDKTTVQGNGSATDQERNKKRPHDDVEEVGAVSSKKQKSGVSSTLIDEVKNLNSQVSSMTRMNSDQLRAQSGSIISQIDQVKAQLSANPEIRPAYQTVLHNRLTHIDDNLRIALSKAGVEYTPPPVSATSSPNPIDRFLGFLTHSQYQLSHLNDMIDQLGMTGKDLSPAKMLTIQMKMSYVSQQIELFTSLLNKALESTKSIMNVQI